MEGALESSCSFSAGAVERVTAATAAIVLTGSVGDIAAEKQEKMRSIRLWKEPCKTAVAFQLVLWKELQLLQML